MAESPVWDIPLERPPRIVSMGRNAHGFTLGDRYRIPDLWSFHLYGYDAVLKLDGHEMTIRPGAIGIAPPGTLMEYLYFGISVHLYVHFALEPGPTRKIGALVDSGGEYEALYADLHEASTLLTKEPQLAAARVWAALWKASMMSAPPEGLRPLHPAVRRTTDVIERHLGERLTVSSLAEEVQITPSYLARLFQEAYGESVVGYIRRRRMEKASYLLQRSSLPIKIIAASVGFSDLHQFYKAVRAEFGVSPREWRSRGG